MKDVHPKRVVGWQNADKRDEGFVVCRVADVCQMVVDVMTAEHAGKGRPTTGCVPLAA